MEIESNGKSIELKKIIKCIEYAKKNQEISNIECDSLKLFLEMIKDTIITFQYPLT